MKLQPDEAEFLMKIPRIYNIGYGTCEESEYIQYHHTEKFTHEELRVIVADCMFVVLNILADDEYRGGLKGEGPQFADIMMNERFEKELEKRGFTRLKFEGNAGVFGWAGSLKVGSWKEYSDEDTIWYQKQMKKKAKKAGITVEAVMEQIKRPGQAPFEHKIYKLKKNHNIAGGSNAKTSSSI